MNEVTGKKQEILCIVTETTQRELSQEASAIRDEMENDGKFEVKIERVRSNKQIAELILDKTSNTQIVHFVAEGNEDGTIDVPDPDRDNEKADNLTPQLLADYFARTNNINCVVLNFCYSKPAAELIAQSTRVPCVIGMEGRIEVQASTDFASGFYKALKGKVVSYKVLEEAFLKGETLAKDRQKEGKYHRFQPIPEMQIETPDNKTTIVPHKCKCKGTFKNLYKGASMWAYVKPTRDDFYYILPIMDNSSDSQNGKWEVTQTIGTPEGNDDDYTIGVFMVDPENTPKFQSDYENADKSQGYKRLSLPTKEIEFCTTGDEERIVKRQ
ncbi:MAG: hypothetical protein VKK42_20035 [Lyngbya sp.]|nr:hypothetical protein [Lyngbya sp.]